MKGEKKIKLAKSLFRFEYACITMDRVNETCDLVTEKIQNDDDPLYYPLIVAICVTYCKPFTANNGLGALPDEFKAFANPDLQNTHNIIFSSRNYMYAHTDLTKMVATDPSIGTKDFLYKLIIDIREEPSALGRKRVFGRGISEPKLRSIIIPDVKILCTEQKRRLKLKADKYTEKIWSGSKRIKPGQRTFSIGQCPW